MIWDSELQTEGTHHKLVYQKGILLVERQKLGVLNSALPEGN